MPDRVPSHPQGLVPQLTELLVLVAVIGLGLTAGALLAEARVLVPFWQSLAPEAFLSWYAANAALLFEFFAPLEIATTVLIILAAIGAAAQRRQGSGWLIAAALLAIGILLAFPVFFKDANASFAAASLATEDVGSAVERWARWHWGRTLAALAAFACALVALKR